MRKLFTSIFPSDNLYYFSEIVFKFSLGIYDINYSLLVVISYIGTDWLIISEFLDWLSYELLIDLGKTFSVLGALKFIFEFLISELFLSASVSIWFYFKIKGSD